MRGKHIKALGPGWHLYWPLTTEVEVIVTARQTLAIPDRVMATKDGKKVVVKTLVVYKVPDVVRAIGKLNWDVDTTINDMTQAAAARVVATHSYDEIMHLWPDHAGNSGRESDEDAHQGGSQGTAAVPPSLTHSAVVEQWPVVRDAHHGVDHPALGHTAEVVLVKVVSGNITLTHTATLTIDRALLPVTDTLNLGQAVAFVLVSGDVLHQYRPFVGEGPADAPTPPSATCPMPVPGIGTTRLCYPVTSPTVFVNLRSPEYGNKDRLSFNRISRETRGGTLVVYADPIWPKTQTMVLTFRGLTYSQVQAYLTFIDAHLGEEVGFVDWEGFYYNPGRQDRRERHWDATSFKHVHDKLEPFPANFPILERKNTLAVLQEIAYQARCALWISNGVFYLKYLPEAPNADDDITASDLDAEKGIEVELTPTEDLITKMVVNWRISWAPGSTDRPKDKSEKTMILRHNVTRYGIQEEEYDWYIYNQPDTIYKCATFWLIRKSHTWKRIRFQTYLQKLNLETFDCTTLDFSAVNRSYVATGAVKALVEKANYNSADNTVDFECLVPVKAGTMSLYPYFWPANQTGPLPGSWYQLYGRRTASSRWQAPRPLWTILLSPVRQSMAGSRYQASGRSGDDRPTPAAGPRATRRPCFRPQRIVDARRRATRSKDHGGGKTARRTNEW